MYRSRVLFSGSCAGVVLGVYGSLFGWVLSWNLLVASDSGSLAGDWAVGLPGNSGVRSAVGWWEWMFPFVAPSK